MRRIYIVALLGLAVPVTYSSAQSCRPSDARSDRMIGTFNRLMTGNDKDNKTRISLQLPSVTTSQILIVTDSAVCARALQALDSVVHVTNPYAPANIQARPLYVIRIGSFIAVSDPNDRSDGRMIINFFDAAWTWLSNLGWRPGPDPS
jgi:hypothetical protein